MIKTILTVSLAVCWLNAVAASFGAPEIGQAAPSLKISTWLQAPPGAPLGWPSGKVVVLEFWATWCGPCVAAIPHLNELAEQFKDKPVQFIAVTDEKENVVRSFLKKTPIKAWVGLTADPIFGEANPYRIDGLPHLVLIDARGRLVAVLRARELTPELIELCLGGQLLPQADSSAAFEVQKALELSADPGRCPQPGVVPGQFLIGRTPIFQVLIRPESTTNSGANLGILRRSRNPCALTSPRTQLKEAILCAFDIDRTRLAVEAPLPKERYDFYISLPHANVRNHMMETVFAQAVEATFGLTLEREMRKVDVLLLRTNATSAERLARSSNGGRKEINGFDEVTGVSRTLSNLAEGLQNAAAEPVLDETGLTNRYSFSIQWEQKDSKHPNIKAMTKAVNGLGLELVPAKRSIEMLIVRTASRGK